MNPLATPVALFVFNRPDVTRRVFEAIAAQRPRRLLLIADGPRPGRAGEAELCTEVRALLEQVDWECSVQRSYSDSNAGSRLCVARGLDWVFQECDRAIILEDDTLPHPTFFRYCEDLLDRYESDERVTMIGGSYFEDQPKGPYSYRFSRYNLTWGWATWRRSWQYYDVEMKQWPALRKSSWLREIVIDDSIARYWGDVFDKVHTGEVATCWDYQWMFSSWVRNGVAIHPSVNLVSNLGFGPNATHTKGDSLLANRPTRPMTFPLRHPPAVLPDPDEDRYLARELCHWVRDTRVKAWKKRSRVLLAQLLPAPLRSWLRSGLRRVSGQPKDSCASAS